jgi:hypothetical protein
MQPLVAPPRDNVTAEQVVDLVQNAPALTVSGGLEIVDLALNVIEDISDSLAGGNVERNSYAVMHGTARLRITRTIDWGGDLLRPYIVLSDGGSVSARFNLGVYHPSTPDWDAEESPPTFEVEGYDVLLRLNQPVGDAFSIAAGQSYLATVESILLQLGYTQYLIDWERIDVVSAGSRVWAFDESTTWLTIVNDLLGAVGYLGVWSDWDGRLRCHPYQNPIERASEWVYSDDQATTMLSTRRTISHDYFSAPNRWVFYRTGLIEGETPVEGNGIFTTVNESVGETSVQARRGLVITRVVGLDVPTQAMLVVWGRQLANADMETPVLYNVETAINPLHWHFDRMLLSDSEVLPVAEVMCTQWSLPLPPDTGDMTQQWRVISQ